MIKPQAKLVGLTQFFGIPDEVLGPPESIEREEAVKAIWKKKQDLGSNPARLIEMAGRECYDSYGKGRSSEEYHQHILEAVNGSVTEHVMLNFRIWNVSRGLTHELVRHRIGTAISQRSTRYVDESESDLAWHPLIEEAMTMPGLSEEACRMVAEAADAQEQAEQAARDAYQAILSLVSGFLTGKLGVDSQTARKQARGAARGALGNALTASLVWSANVRALRNVLEQRCSPFADAEIRLLANRLYEEALAAVPEYFSDYRKVECPDGIGYGLETDYRKI
jgi:thymidylate synthase (FAD)